MVNWRKDRGGETMPLEMETVETLEAAALHLPLSERARLVERLIATLDADPEVEEAWAAEVERRQAEIESGTVSLLSGPESLARLKAEFQ
jgi:putative addiction module component (TIGR02574 family)